VIGQRLTAEVAFAAVGRRGLRNRFLLGRQRTICRHPPPPQSKTDLRSITAPGETDFPAEAMV
jgi:hypothetical protein